MPPSNAGPISASSPPTSSSPAAIRARPPPKARRYRSMVDVMRDAPVATPVVAGEYGDLKCEECRRGDGDEEMLICDTCDRGFHVYCLRPILVRVPSGFPLKQKKIVDFFRIQRRPALERCGALQDTKRRRRRSMPLVVYKKRRRLLPFSPTEDPARRLEQMSSLATALTSLQMKFSNELTYMSGMAPRSANQASLEKGGMQILSKKDIDTLEYCRTMCTRGECPPLLVIFDSCEGFTVEADGPIKDMTLIAEYTGDVDYIKNREHDDCDSMMTLLLATNTSHSLVICPDKRGNIARFINGINNHTPEGRKKQNLKCVRYDVNGECRALLIACRDICKGERLYYDYNGYEQEYPTHHFV
ncbi:Histone-lysine N-methyltransferase ATXR5 [Acorus calamus]|uniref:[histone H3]-lysine(27) N-methyltransferase n=1 Tax=Acorus calamus TaxID=4465 RepID=A0AAV9DIB7_ACOCL|nr:Histone-lysine N-methyltransferase ATXR5 [Acorus calamus]